MIANIPSVSNGITSPEVVNGTITTAFRYDYFKKATKLAMLRTMIHESLHAYMVAYETLNGKTQFLSTFSKAFKSYKETNRDKGIEQHNQIANNMRALISNMLKEFDKNRQSQQFYDDLAWGGLDGTDEYEALSDLEKDRIKNTLFNEQEGNGNSKGDKCVDTGENCR